MLSGFAGLMHQVIWAKLLVRLIGSTAPSQAIVLAVFMAGLALGALAFGRRADRGRPLMMYVALEVVIAVYGLALPLLIDLTGSGYLLLATRLFDVPAARLPLRAVLAALCVLPPAVCMGGTLPLLARHLTSRPAETRRQVGNLYAMNSLGAVLGAGFAGFIALPSLGLIASLALASGLNLAAAALLFAPARRERSPGDGDRTAPAEGHARRGSPAAAYGTLQFACALAALAMSGFAAMGYEVLFTRVIALAFGASVYSFTVMLMCFICGIALGSAIAAHLTVKRPLLLFAASQLAAVVGLLLVTPFVSRLPYLITLLRFSLRGAPHGFELYQLGSIGYCLAALILPTTCLGLAFPLVAQIQARRPDRVGWAVGSTYAWNTLGNVLGAVLTSLVLLPGLGLAGAFHLNMGLSLVAGLGLLVVGREAAGSRRMALGLAAIAAVGIYAVIGTRWLEPIDLAPNHMNLRPPSDPKLTPMQRLRHPASSFEAWKKYFVLARRPDDLHFFEEDAHTTVAVAGRDSTLYVDGKPDASLSADDLETQLLLGHAPLFLAPHARSVLLIGYGSGMTAGAALTHPITREDIVEISPAVLHADRVYADENHHVLEDPRVHVFVDDGQSFVRSVPRSYDVIVSEPSNPWMAGVSSLFTVDFFEAVRRKLNPDGVFCFWFHTYWMSDEMVTLVLRSLETQFPHVMVFGDDDLGNIIAVASPHPIEPDFDAMEARFRRPGVRANLGRLGITSLVGFLSHHRVSQERFKSSIPPGPTNTVNRQRLAYAAPRSLFEGRNATWLLKLDELVREPTATADVLLDRYLAFRAESGRPVSPATLRDAARYADSIGGFGPRVAEALRWRATHAGP